MKNSVYAGLWVVLLGGLLPGTASAHVVISAGDLAVVSIFTNEARGPVRFSFVTLESFHPPETVLFTDRGWLASEGRFRAGEGVTFWDVERTVPIGTVVELPGDTGISLHPGADSIIGLVGALAPDGTPTDTLIFGLNLGAPWAADASSDQTSALPPSLTGFEVALEGGMDCAYAGPTVGVRSEILALIRDPAQWRCSDSERPAPATAFTVYRDPGDRCSADAECAPGAFCAYGVCCETECRRDLIGHCTTCEEGTGRCIASPAGTLCRGPGGPCDPADSCDGVGMDCPPNALAGPELVCREATAGCDPEERCTGESRECPEDVSSSPGAVCRPSTGPCDPSELCDVGSECPADVFAPDGTECDDGLVCTAFSSCADGRCAGPVPLECDDADPCTADMCSDLGGCMHAPIAGCCRSDADCAEDDPCAAGRCDADHRCVTEPSGLCDASGAIDAGTASGADAGPRFSVYGDCGCRITRREVPLRGWAWLAALALVHRRRRSGAGRRAPPARTPRRSY